ARRLLRDAAPPPAGPDAPPPLHPRVRDRRRAHPGRHDGLRAHHGHPPPPRLLERSGDLRSPPLRRGRGRSQRPPVPLDPLRRGAAHVHRAPLRPHALRAPLHRALQPLRAEVRAAELLPHQAPALPLREAGRPAPRQARAARALRPRREAQRALLARRRGARARPVWRSATAATSSGVPSATMRPPPAPPSGPRSITWSEAAITSRWCSITSTVFPASTRRWSTSRRRRTSSKCRPVVGSSRT